MSVTQILTTDLQEYISALKTEMLQRGYSPQTMRGFENVWDNLTRYASSVPSVPYDESFKEEFVHSEYGVRLDLEYTMFRVSRALELLRNYIEFGIIIGVPKKDPHVFSEGYYLLMTSFGDS